MLKLYQFSQQVQSFLVRIRNKRELEKENKVFATKIILKLYTSTRYY